MVSPERKDMNTRAKPSAKTEGTVVVFIPWTTMVLVPIVARTLSTSDLLPGNSSKFQNVVRGILAMGSEERMLR